MTKISPLQTIEHALFKKHKISVSIKRDDLIHPTISGNKWRKLKYNLTTAKKLGYKGIDSAELIFDNYSVSAKDLIGEEEGKGFLHTLGGLELGRINVAARGVGEPGQ